MPELSRLRHNLEAEVRKRTKTAEERRERMERLSEEAVLCLSKTIDAKDKYTNGHSERVAKYSREIARRAGIMSATAAEVIPTASAARISPSTPASSAWPTPTTP